MTAIRPHSDAQPVSASEPSGSTPGAGEAARVARYAEALVGVQWHRVTADAVARAVMAVADQETAELRAEVEQRDRALTALDRLLGGARDRAEAAEAESARLASVVAKVEALVDEWGVEIDAMREEATDNSDAFLAYRAGAFKAARRRLRAALESVAPDTATPGEVPPECLTHAHIPWNNWCTPASSADKAGE